MKYYTLAVKESKTYGHGDFGEEYSIPSINGYHTNSKKFHPLFTTPEKAENYKNTLEWNHNFVIVEMEVSI